MVLKKQSSLSSNCIPSMKAQVVLREPEIGYFMSIIPQLKKREYKEQWQILKILYFNTI